MNRVQKILNKANLGSNECIILSKPANIFYASGYVGEGYAILAEGLQAIVTDFRYTEQATKEAPAFSIHEIKTGASHEYLMCELLKERNITSVRYEDDYVTVAGFSKIQKAMPGIDFSPLCGVVELVRQIKDADEIALIERACAISDEAFAYVLGEVKEGMTEIDLRLALEFKMYQLGAEELAFPSIIASGKNGSLCHAIPSTKKLEKGDMITMDFGAKYGGYCADMTRTIALGNPSDEMKKIYDTVLYAHETAQSAVRAGLRGCDVDKIARDIINNAGYEGCFGHGLGHSLGIDIHESPRFSVACDTVVEAGMFMTVEPGIYIPDLGGVRIENTVLVLENGMRPITQSPKELIII